MKASLPFCLLLVISTSAPPPATARHSDALHGSSQESARLGLLVEASRNAANQGLYLKSLRHLRDHQATMGALDSALQTSQKIVAINGISADRFSIASDWQQMARLYQQAGDLPGAVLASKKSLLLMKTIGNKAWTRAATMEMLDLLLAAGRYAEFRYQSEGALDACKAAGDRAGQAMVEYRQGLCLIAQGRFPDALSVLHLALRNRDAVQDDGQLGRILFALAQANAGVAQWPAARDAMAEALQLAPQAPVNSPELYQLQSRIDEGLGDPQGALRSERLATIAKDSLFKVHGAEQLARLQALHAVDTKENELAELQETKLALNAKLRSERFKARASLLFCAGLSVILLTILLRRSWLGTQARRARLQRKVVEAQAKDLETKYSELEQHSLMLSQALVGEEARKLEQSKGMLTAGFAANLFGLQVRVERGHAGSSPGAMAMDRLHGRAKVMALVDENLAKPGSGGGLMLRPHLIAIAEAAFRERGLLEKLRLELNAGQVDLDLDELMTLSLLFHELLTMTMDQHASADLPVMIEATLANLGERRCELLYTDRCGSITGAALGPGTPHGAQVHLLANALHGSIMLLKGEETTLQLTFESRSRTAMRMAV